MESGTAVGHSRSVGVYVMITHNAKKSGYFYYFLDQNYDIAGLHLRKRVSTYRNAPFFIKHEPLSAYIFLYMQKEVFLWINYKNYIF